MPRFTYKTIEFEGRYYARFRTLPTADGAEVRALTTRYTYEMFRKPAGVDPRTGTRLYRIQYRNVYYAGGIFYKSANIPTRFDDGIPGDFINALVPFSGRIWDRYPKQSEAAGFEAVEMQIADGRPVSVSVMPAEADGDAEVIWCAEIGDFGPVAEYLGLNKRPRKSPNKAA